MGNEERTRAVFFVRTHTHEHEKIGNWIALGRIHTHTQRERESEPPDPPSVRVIRKRKRKKPNKRWKRKGAAAEDTHPRHIDKANKILLLVNMNAHPHSTQLRLWRS